MSNPKVIDVIGQEAGFIGIFILFTALVYTFGGPKMTFNLLIIVFLGQIITSWPLIDSKIKEVIPK